MESDSIFLSEREIDLVEKLKSLCNENKTEKDPKQSAKILYQLGLVYAEKSDDKIALIQSAVLLNAALIRQPDNIQTIKKDLATLCSSVLKEARAVNLEADLVKISETIKIKIDNMRTGVNFKLDEEKNDYYQVKNMVSDVPEHWTKKIESIMNIQNFITSKYMDVMCCVAEHCIEIMPKLPCKFALVGMGSLARKEITPYSDFENIILLEDSFDSSDDTVYERFRWFAVVFQIILINLGETIIPSVSIPSLNNIENKHHNWFYDNFTNAGISFDGFMPHACKSPFGRYYRTKKRHFTTELIKKVSDMVAYLDSKEDLKNGYHLADVLSGTCFVFGDETVFEEFSTLSRNKLDYQRQHCSIFREQLSKQVKEDERSYEIWRSLETLHRNFECDMKRIVYRSSTVFISALGKFYGADSPSSFEIVQYLAKNGILSDKDEAKLMYAVAVACEVRLRAYIKKGGLKNIIKKTVSESTGYVTELFDLVGENAILDYFAITQSLQLALPDFSKTTPDRLYCRDKQFTKASIYYFLNMYEKSIAEFRSLSASQPQTDELTKYTRFRIGFNHFYLKSFKDAIEDFLAVVSILNKETKPSIEDQVTIHRCHSVLGDCYRNLKLYKEALEYYDKLSESFIQSTELNNQGIVYLKIGQFEAAMKCFERGIEVASHSKDELSKDKQKNVAMFIYNKGRCCYEKGLYKDALQHFQTSLTLRLEVTLDGSLDINLSLTYYNIGRCYFVLSNLPEAERQILTAQRIQEDLPSVHGDPVLADTLCYLGRCKLTQMNYKEALICFEKELAIRKRLPKEQNTNHDDIANCFAHLAQCFTALCVDDKANFFHSEEEREREQLSRTES